MNKFIDFTKQVFRGKSISRILFNWQVAKHCQNLKGKCVDLGSGRNPSYSGYWSFAQGAKLIRSDVDIDKNTDLIIDLNKPLPLTDNSVDNIFLFNAIYIIRKPEELLKEIQRVLKNQGQLFMASPYISNEMREPDDFRRLTSQGLEDLMLKSGFSDFQIIPFGERASAGVHLWHPYFLFNFIRFFAFSKGLLLDRLLPKKIKRLYPCPLGYFIIAKK